MSEQSKPLWQHAEEWWKEQGKEVPTRGTEAYQQMYETYINWAFQDFTEALPD